MPTSAAAHLAGSLQFGFEDPGQHPGIFQEVILAGAVVRDGRHHDFVEIEAHAYRADGKLVFDGDGSHASQGHRCR